ncbi:YbfB/YjiJ family MFS transporter [Cupriavidus necator]|uniref:YbfB/YjiJ family MFS transporter n=1 Tax=Cupriavidus necator TaxID=106590 RepID=UPI003ECDA56C
MSAHPTPYVSHATAPSRAWQSIVAGFSASLVSIGLARFAYAPLVPPLIEAHWFSSSNVVFLGAANLAGYLVGALIGHPLARRSSSVATLRGMMALVTVAFVACAWPLSVPWFFVWRLASGIAGGAIMVLAAGTILPHVPRERRGLASGAIFLGIGVGIAGSGTAVPLLLGFGLRTTWIGLAALSAGLTAATWFAWPHDSAASGHAVHAGERRQRLDGGVALLFMQYGLMAVALVPAMVFLVDFVARGLGAGAHAGARFWVMYGIGAIAGPPLYGWLADRLGARPALRLTLAAQALAVGVFWLSGDMLWLAAATMVIGTFPPGIVPLALARVHERIHDHHAQSQAWSRATISFAACQALAGYAYSAVFSANGGNHRTLFGIALAALVFAIVSDFAIPEMWLARADVAPR